MSSNFSAGVIFIFSSTSAFRVDRAFLTFRFLPQVIEFSLLIGHPELVLRVSCKPSTPALRYAARQRFAEE